MKQLKTFKESLVSIKKLLQTVTECPFKSNKIHTQVLSKIR